MKKFCGRPCTYDIKFGMLQVRKNEISLRKCSGGSAHLHSLEWTQDTRESARFGNNDSEPKSQVRLHIAVIFFFAMNFVKSNYRATLKNEHLGELICTALITYCPDFRGLENLTKT